MGSSRLTWQQLPISQTKWYLTLTCISYLWIYNTITINQYAIKYILLDVSMASISDKIFLSHIAWFAMAHLSTLLPHLSFLNMSWKIQRYIVKTLIPKHTSCRLCIILNSGGSNVGSVGSTEPTRIWRKNWKLKEIRNGYIIRGLF